MSKVIDKRMTVEIEGSFVVFLIGFRINKPWKIHKWLPVALAMPRILKELEAHPECGCLATEVGFGTIIQYWRSFDHLEAYARAKDEAHWPAWVNFNRSVGGSRGDVGIWHETFLVNAGNYEAIYSGVPPRGLGKAGKLVPATGQLESARTRLMPAP